MVTETESNPNQRARGDGRPVVALVLLVITYLVAALAIWLYLAVRPPWHVGQWYFLVDLADAIVYGAVGWVLLSRVSRPVVWIVAATALGGAVAAASSQWTQYQPDHPDLPKLALFGSGAPMVEAALRYARRLGPDANASKTWKPAALRAGDALVELTSDMIQSIMDTTDLDISVSHIPLDFRKATS